MPSLDATGKVSLDHIYAEPDPRPFYGTLRELDYQMPQRAKPFFAELIDEYREERQVPAPTVVDVGCSYGVNAALYRCDTTMDELYDHYTGQEAAGLDRSGLLDRDRDLVQSHDNVRFIGLDASAPALEYAHAAGFIDDAIHADLERHDLTEDQRALLAEADLVVSTGCIGYVTERTIVRIAEPARRRPWMAHFVLRMFSYEPVATSLSELGYETIDVPGMFKQRRFASDEEQEQILDALRATGVEPHELENEGWLCAQLHLSRPGSKEESEQ